MFLKTRFKSIIPSHDVVDVHTLGATDAAVVTLRGPAGAHPSTYSVVLNVAQIIDIRSKFRKIITKKEFYHL